MLEQIIHLRKEGMSFRKIAKELDMSLGKVQYQWTKYTKEVEKSEEKESSLPKDYAEASPAIPPFLWTSIQTLKKSNGMEAWVAGENKAFIFWSIPTAKWKLISSYCGFLNDDLSLKMRIYDITSIYFDGSNAHTTLEIQLDHDKNQLVFEGLQPNRSYCFEVGIQDGSRSFMPLLKSNPLHTPRTSISQSGENTKDVIDWSEGKSPLPNWIEHVSTYSYYETEAKESVKKQ
ncbi:DUF4912 domain-containing protein [Niallia taxi]|uniref:DUF4912 domain-containing protein n=2 Tax=Niallia taxi TaxID=2499688 RepID=UPI0021A4A214|nr:DUF4912 domain-containing protein [Niallia taxi]MCT2343309.1 DUF4912 domain-containing protein [Niallia taxi]MDE5052169.1 DUF4912 domain-containing protein [Niallia taxi]WOD64335.1 DUF4912 domain-containing protein [Niallia taxi]